MYWDAVTIAVPFDFDTTELKKEIEYFQKIGFITCKDLYILNDPFKDPGSGGSTLNALVHTVTRLTRRRFCTISSEEEVLNTSNILIILIGHESRYRNFPDPNKKCLLIEWTYHGRFYVPNTYFCNAYKKAKYMAQCSRKTGLWIIGTDSSWDWRELPNSIQMVQKIDDSEITAFAFLPIRKNNEYHGNLCDQGTKKFIRMEYSNKDGIGSWRALAFFYFPPSVARTFFRFHQIYPITDSTFVGIDNGGVGLKLSIFFDFLLATGFPIHTPLRNIRDRREAYVNHEIGKEKCEKVRIQDLRRCREIIFKEFGKITTRIYDIRVCNYKYNNGHDFYEFGPGDFYDHLRRSLICKLTRNNDYAPSNLLELSFSVVLNTLSTGKRNQNRENEDYFKALIQSVENCHDDLSRAHVLCTMAIGLANEAEVSNCLLFGSFGSTANPTFSKFLKKLREVAEISGVLKDLVKEVAKNWRGDDSKMTRAAAHLEEASRIVISRCVFKMCRKALTLPVKVETEEQAWEIATTPLFPRDTVTVTAPARVDLYGGWLDTPPIFFYFENATVCNLAVKVDGKNPITCKIDKIETSGVILVEEKGTVEFNNNEDLLKTSSDPTKSGCLLCACIVALGFKSISKFLNEINGTGIRVTLSSTLPHGSGLGTSSIMAAAILKAIWVLANGSRPDKEQLVLTVLKVEQVMTTGGGWQDQVGAIYPGLKLGIAVRSYGSTKHSIECERIKISEKFEAEINKRLILIYTGTTRLAKNTLQKVIRNWYLQKEAWSALRWMLQRTEEFSYIIKKGVMPIELIKFYYYIKKEVAEGVEPEIVKVMLAELEDMKLIETGWMAGAGGGGFCYVWATEDAKFEDIQGFLKRSDKYKEMTCHTITISNDDSL